MALELLEARTYLSTDPGMALAGVVQGAIGNSISNLTTHVQSNINALASTPNGTLIGDTPWEEGGAEATIYNAGTVVGTAVGTHGWGAFGGAAAAANNTYFYVALTLTNGGNGQDSGYNMHDPSALGQYPPYDPATATSDQWWGVERYTLAGQPAPYAGGLGQTLQQAFTPVTTLADYVGGVKTNADGSIAGMAASNTVLYTTTPATNLVQSFDALTMQPLAQWHVENPGAITVDPTTGNVWVVQGAPGRRMLTAYSATGAPCGVQIITDGNPVSLSFAFQGTHLYVADGTANTIDDLTIAANLPVQSHVIGTALLNYNGTEAPLRFLGIKAIAVDANNNLYVAENRTGLDTKISGYSAAGTLLWSLESTGSINIGSPDPQNTSTWYGLTNRMTYDYTTGNWVQDAVTINPQKYPGDLRLPANGNLASATVRYISGEKFLFCTGMYNNMVAIYRFDPATDGEIAIPCGMIDFSSGKIWCDANGDGIQEPGELLPGLTSGTVWGCQIAANGDLTITYENDRIAQLPCQGLDANGVPRYDFSTSTWSTAPAPFSGEGSQTDRAVYNAADDSMILTGYTPALPRLVGAYTPGSPPTGGETWGQVGKVLCVYDNWSTTPVLRYQIILPFDPTQPLELTHAMAVAGGQIFLIDLIDNRILDYRQSDGAYLGTITPQAGTTQGWIDAMNGLQAVASPDGHVILSAEEEIGAKMVVYQVPALPGS